MLTRDASREQERTAGTRFGPAQAIVDRYEAIDVEQHPFCRGLSESPPDLRTIWLFMVNLREGVSREFVTWLATAIARIADRRIGSLIAKQLDDELGGGDYERIHTLLLDRFVGALAPWSVNAPEATVLAPGQRLAQDAARPFFAPEPYEGVGALMSGEIFARKMDLFLGAQIRRQNQLSDEALAWLTVHEQLEIHHADDSGSLATLVPSEGPELAATWRGAEAQWNSLWAFLDRLQQLRGELLSRATPS